MHVITFYSFRGGVGRSMALVNVGVELASAGKRVLLVDFDLEAPSLTSFDLEAAKSCRLGVVDYVLDYLKNDRAANIDNYVSAPQSFPSGGSLWIMPAGFSEDYQAHLTTINWLDLYEHRSGFLLMEEMKAQWKSQLTPDYVLVDSRTGHSDVSGICTRQLPNTVCFIFAPTRQNLDGLAVTAQQVRAASEEPEIDIAMLFVESNVPYYDDERRTLEKNRKQYLERLDISSFSATIHQHPHLSVLTQSVFVQEFPETSLSQEYRHLTDLLRRENMEDREAVLPQLQKIAADLRASRGLTSDSEVTEKLSEISRLHGTNAEICFWLGRISRHLGETDQALIQINQAIDLGFRNAEAYLERASLTLREKTDTRVEDAVKDFRMALRVLGDEPTYPEVLFAVRSLISHAPSLVPELSESPAIYALPVAEQIILAADIITSDEAADVAYAVLKRLRDRNLLTPEDAPSWLIDFALTCIHKKRFSEAIDALTEGGPLSSNDEGRLFNLAIARWALTGSKPMDDFAAVLKLHDKRIDRLNDPNYLQCIAIASYLHGDIGRATMSLDRARMFAERTPTLHFSAWRYLKVSPRDFVADCRALARQIELREDLVFPAIQPSQDTLALFN